MNDPSKAMRDAYDDALWTFVTLNGDNVDFFTRVPERESKQYVRYSGVIVSPSDQYCKGGDSLSITMMLDVVTRFTGSGGYDDVDDIASQVTTIIIARPTTLTVVGWSVITSVIEQISPVVEEQDDEYLWFIKQIQIKHEIQSS